MPIAWPKPRVIVADVSAVSLTPAQSAGHGAVWGALVGDAAGAVLEFCDGAPSDRDVAHALQMPGGGVFGVAPGQVTDDGELAIALAQALAANGGRYVASTVSAAYVDWAESNPFDIGSACRSAFGHGRTGRALTKMCQQEALAFNAASQANGALMRVTPLAVAAAAWTAQAAARWAAFDAALSHPHPICQQANAAYVLAIRHLVRAPKDHAGAINASREYLQSVQSEVAHWLHDALHGRLPDAKWQMGFVRHGFTRAFFHLHQGSSFHAAIGHTLSAGGDTDTNACIVGGLMGAYWGATQLLQDELTQGMFKSVMQCDTRQGQSRPHKFHPARMWQHLLQFKATQLAPPPASL